MGLLTTGGKPMRWGTDENNRAIPHVSSHGIQQFLTMRAGKKEEKNFPFYWGEEVEHQLVRVEGGKVKLSLNAADVIEQLTKSSQKDNAVWHQEYGSFMVESVPGVPYTLEVDSLCSVEGNIRRRCELLDSVAGENTFSLTLVTFPLMGVGDFITSDSKEVPYSRSLFVPDVCINQSHPRFTNLTRNIRLRRGHKVCIQVPIYIDTYTMEKTVDPRLNIDRTPHNIDIDCSSTEVTEAKGEKFTINDSVISKEKENNSSNNNNNKDSNISSKYPSAEEMTHFYTPATHYYYAQYFKKSQMELVKQRYDACPCPVPSVSHPCIYMDCMAFGMGCNCLQVTMQLENETQARHVYDQLGVLCPLFLAMSSSTPFQKGILCDSDVRWLTIAASVDDRKREEVPHIIKSRYDSFSVFVSLTLPNLEEFNDEEFVINDTYLEVLKSAGVDTRLAKHVAHLFIRDPLVVYDQMIDIDDTTHTEHFENIQSTNWQSVRLKPPSLDGNTGWRVEFRIMDVMPTPFENAAFSVFVPLLARAIIKYNPLFYTKMSIVDENMGYAHNRSPCRQKYVMRRDIFAKNISTDPSENSEFTVNEVFNGKDGEYYGLIPLVRRYMEEENMLSSTLEGYLCFLSMRAAGEIPTAAEYLRNFVMQHPDYGHDSRLTERIAYDLVLHVRKLASGEVKDDLFLPMNKFMPKRSRE
ncbi:putative gamma-glutamylcysteine synthetase [Trypanosoma cruzi]|uniref:Glutamate--cysteine ligase n=2 Tax=Trypanosoma cruzi TaxID=5693 RepID=Q4DHS1_TRYCC|nr:gamma-glutamylcysteine synthetase, putative [Trypanosoma cruzi]EAN92075.1 gamma-glutamylcysteine synthetase, putative [Trypanosoma cruzi]RNC44785.1 putative gamma-glutamylcysteine synthetase [Trypanosoma cruzi]|eukprot:XP_813926.1 gamma-glutamylcysteine synthetase [Trypanosoma cruzi strain CL Brener]